VRSALCLARPSGRSRGLPVGADRVEERPRVGGEGVEGGEEGVLQRPPSRGGVGRGGFADGSWGAEVDAGVLVGATHSVSVACG
jgi:hypothetical protein